MQNLSDHIWEYEIVSRIMNSLLLLQHGVVTQDGVSKNRS